MGQKMAGTTPASQNRAHGDPEPVIALDRREESQTLATVMQTKTDSE